MIRGSAGAGTALLALAGCLEAPPAMSEGPPAGCGTVSALEDEFDGDDYNRARWGGSGGVSVSGGAARIVSGPGVYNTLQSVPRYRVSGGQLVAALDVSQLANGLMAMELESPDGFLVSITLLNGELGFHVSDAGGDGMLDSAPLEQDIVWWRIREDAGNFFWATSPDGTDESSWTERGPFEASIGELARVDFELLPNSEASTLVVEAVNPGSDEVYCPAASVKDEFASRSERWSVDEQGDCQITFAGQAELGYSAQAFCALTTRERFDLRDSSFAIELAQIGDCIPEPTMRIAIAYDDVIELKCADQGGDTKLVAKRNAAEVASAVYQPDEHKFVRVRHDSAADNVLFESSTGDGVWTGFGSSPVSSELLAETSLRFYLGGETSGGFETVAFDSLNLAP